MVKLHIICGVCGSNNKWVHEVCQAGEVNMHCAGCDSTHRLADYVKRGSKMSDKKIKDVTRVKSLQS